MGSILRYVTLTSFATGIPYLVPGLPGPPTAANPDCPAARGGSELVASHRFSSWQLRGDGLANMFLAGKHMYFYGLFNLEDVHDDVDYAVFEDLAGGFQFFHQYKGWFGCQSDIQLSGRYRKHRRISWGKPSIWMSNEDPRASAYIDLDWWDRNVDTVYIGDWLARPHSDQ